MLKELFVLWIVYVKRLVLPGMPEGVAEDGVNNVLLSFLPYLDPGNDGYQEPYGEDSPEVIFTGCFGFLRFIHRC